MCRVQIGRDLNLASAGVSHGEREHVSAWTGNLKARRLARQHHGGRLSKGVTSVGKLYRDRKGIWRIRGGSGGKGAQCYYGENLEPDLHDSPL